MLPASAAQFLSEEGHFNGPMAVQSDKKLQAAADACKTAICPAGSEGYRTAEVTLGGIDTDELNSRSMQSKKVPGLYFIGEAGRCHRWLGGYNFQWAWASGYVCGEEMVKMRQLERENGCLLKFGVGKFLPLFICAN